MGGSWWRDLTECGPLEKGMANHFSILALSDPGIKPASLESPALAGRFCTTEPPGEPYSERLESALSLFFPAGSPTVKHAMGTEYTLS